VTHQSPIVVIDSGLGGLTVARAIRSVLPNERIVYFGDTARLPYGSKSAVTVTTFVKQIIGYLRSHCPKHIVIACNTATALALPSLRAEFPDLSISGVIDPGARAAAEAAGEKLRPVIGVIATEATIRSKAYERALRRRRNHAHILLRSTPLLVPIIEEGRDMNDTVVRLAVAQYLQPLVERKIDVLLLGCTHYPLLKGLFVEMLGMAVHVIDSAQTCAEDVRRRLSAAGLLHRGDVSDRSFQCYVTDDSPKFSELASKFLGFEVDPPTWVKPEELYNQHSAALLRQAI
jgi:glutamate racemase